MAQTRIGISGWTYTPWRGTFFPKGLVQHRELHFASRQLNSIEINGSFYSLQLPSSFQKWHDETPEGFVFSVKGPRFITHMKKLKNVRTPLANFFASGVLCLKEKLGPILWQFPPGFGWDAERFEAFFEMLPRDTRAATKLAKEHDSRLEGRSWTKTDANRPIRYAVEIRHDSFKNEQFVRLLRKHQIALVFADTAGKWPYIEDVTADFIYVRLHGDEELYVSGYTEEALDWWAKRIGAWRTGGEPTDAKRVLMTKAKRCKTRDAFIYFDNDVKVRAPYDAMGLARRLGVSVPDTVANEAAIASVKATARTSWPGFKKR